MPKAPAGQDTSVNRYPAILGIDKICAALLEVEDEEEATQLFEEFAAQGHFRISSPSIAEVLLKIIEGSLKYPKLRALAIKQLDCLYFEPEETAHYQRLKNGILTRDKVNLFILEITDESTPVEQSLAALTRIIGIGMDSEFTSSVLAGLMPIVSLSPYEVVRRKATEALDKLPLTNEKRTDYRKRIDDLLTYSNNCDEIDQMVHHILYLNEKEALLKCAELIIKFFIKYPEETKDALFILLNSIPQSYHRLKKVINNALEQLSLDKMEAPYTLNPNNDEVRPVCVYLGARKLNSAN